MSKPFKDKEFESSLSKDEIKDIESKSDGISIGDLIGKKETKTTMEPSFISNQPKGKMEGNETFEKNFVVLQRYMKHLYKDRALARNTLSNKFYSSRILCEVMSVKNRSIYEVNAEDVSDVKFLMEENNRSKNVIKLFMLEIRGFISWMNEMDMLKCVNKEWIRNIGSRMRLKTDYSKVRFVPVCEEIFSIRRNPFGDKKSGVKNVRTRHAAMFEVTLSSGLRKSEIINIRANDIDFDASVIDNGKQSIYVGGSINLDNRRISIKNREGRVTYFSRIARRMLLRHMKIEGIKIGSNVPLFPVSVRGANDWMTGMIKAEPIWRMIDERYSNKEKAIPSSPSFDDIDLEEDSSGLSERLKRMIKNRQDYVDNTISGREDFIDKKRNIGNNCLEPAGFGHHCLRHFFSVFMMYRTYEGRTGDIVSVGRMLGHKSFSTTETYLKSLIKYGIRNDEQWKRISLGTKTDWVFCID